MLILLILFLLSAFFFSFIYSEISRFLFPGPALRFCICIVSFFSGSGFRNSLCNYTGYRIDTNDQHQQNNRRCVCLIHIQSLACKVIHMNRQGSSGIEYTFRNLCDRS